MSFYFKNDTNIYISTAATIGAATSGNTNKIKIKDLSFNQDSTSVDISRKTVKTDSIRASKFVVEDIKEVSFSFTTYLQPFLITTVRVPDEYLWLSLMGSNTINRGASLSSISFANGNVASLLPLIIWIENAGTYIRLDSAVITEADISLNIESLGTVEWKGTALAIDTEASAPAAYTDRSTRTEFLKTKLSVLDLTVGTIQYDVALTGGTIKITNDVDFYGRKPLGEVGTIVGHQTKNRKIEGTLELYLKSITTGSLELYTDILNNISSSTYEADQYAVLDIQIGGITAPYINFSIPKASIDIPQIGFDDVFTISVPFAADETSDNYCVIQFYA